jgi:2OG-Fe(II) oxygenase superfamily
MERIISTAQFCVYDEFEPKPSHESIWSSLQQELFTPVPAGLGAHRIDDGQPLRCDRSFFWTRLSSAEVPQRETWKPRLAPSEEPCESFISRVAEISGEHEGLVGRSGEDWAGIILTPHLYRRGDSVSWHTDGLSYTGAFVYYAHPTWNCVWGGELLVVDDGTPSDQRSLSRKCVLDNQVENARLSRPGVGRFIFPNPNRLVFVKGGADHMISKVYDAAGNNVRAGLSGFFLKRESLERTICSYQSTGTWTNNLAKRDQ